MRLADKANAFDGLTADLADRSDKFGLAVEVGALGPL
jgi:hypothetical protein